jgi:hypothetical protein
MNVPYHKLTLADIHPLYGMELPFDLYCSEEYEEPPVGKYSHAFTILIRDLEILLKVPKLLRCLLGMVNINEVDLYTQIVLDGYWWHGQFHCRLLDEIRLEMAQ